VQSVAGILYVVATPIGNLADMTFRAVEVLKQVDLIAAEDTRHSARLMEHFSVKTPMLAYHDHNEEYQSSQIIEKLKAGQNIALISDAGTPLINDPGYRLLKQIHDEGLKVVPVPGANAVVTALSVSGLAVNYFAFDGFAPVKSQARQAYFARWSHSEYAHVFYESSHRIVDSLSDMQAALGDDREICLGRELTKTFETIRRGRLADVIDFVRADPNQQKGEFVVIVSRAEEVLEESEREVRQMLEKVLPILSVKQASQVVAVLTGQKKNQIYQLALEMQQD
jgi:16S rRNA (cytidine1402-2'-O)-methyltransferase